MSLLKSEEIISDAEIERVHANANFGDMAKRDVVNSGVIKAAFGYGTGSTAYRILRDHRLVKKFDRRGLRLTQLGYRYLRSIVSHATLLQEHGVRGG
ncbi:hypothetical protein GCM10007094_14790 [Pseudovibrio japonicus]|uniref:Uncharacterized protein n=1 Tax=Pseudovibrio japonicus TaxID=366534 RepID=A0ABQ3E6G1_9HYPH|nr:hypothetical protein [Pseudovibrio japonicus]GHB27506.1 hypothetical protein GCM10007094_14790 [Pseudovibrio japonicus]